MQAGKEDSSREDSRASNSKVDTDITDTMDTTEEASETDGEAETNTIRCRDTSTLTTGRDGTTPTTRDFSSRSKSSSRSTMLTVPVNFREKSSSMPTEISAFRWEWPLPITTRKSGRPSSKLTPTETAESTSRKWSCSSRKFREFSSKEDKEDNGEDNSSKEAKDGEDSSNRAAKDGEAKAKEDREWEDSKDGVTQDRTQDGEAKVAKEWEDSNKAGEDKVDKEVNKVGEVRVAREASKDGEDKVDKEVNKAGEAKEDREAQDGDLSSISILFSITNTLLHLFTPFSFKIPTKHKK